MQGCNLCWKVCEEASIIPCYMVLEDFAAMPQMACTLSHKHYSEHGMKLA